MIKHDVPNPIRISEPPAPIFQIDRANHCHPIFRGIWFAGNVLLILSILLAAYSAAWEYSTRRYLEGFSDAVVPASATDEKKIEAILNWMSSGPARLQSGPADLSQHRDPIETLNYASLLHVCGSATSAFVNLADSAGLKARRLLLLDSRRMTNHVVAEVLMGGRWIVLDPAYRAVFRDADGQLVTREELTDPAVFSAATGGIRGYPATYTFDRTSHIRLSRLGAVGQLLRRVLDGLLPGWEDSATMTLLVERESFTALVASIALVLLLFLFRISLRWYSETRYGVQPPRMRKRILQACGVLFSAPDRA